MKQLKTRNEEKKKYRNQKLKKKRWKTSKK